MEEIKEEKIRAESRANLVREIKAMEEEDSRSNHKKSICTEQEIWKKTADAQGRSRERQKEEYERENVGKSDTMCHLVPCLFCEIAYLVATIRPIVCLAAI